VYIYTKQIPTAAAPTRRGKRPRGGRHGTGQIARDKWVGDGQRRTSNIPAVAPPDAPPRSSAARSSDFPAPPRARRERPRPCLVRHALGRLTHRASLQKQASPLWPRLGVVCAPPRPAAALRTPAAALRAPAHSAASRCPARARERRERPPSTQRGTRARVLRPPATGE